MLIEREVPVHDVDLVLIPLRQRGKQLGMHLCAIRALQVIKAYDEHRGICGSTSRRASVSTYEQLRILADVVLAELRQCLAVGRKKKRDRLAGLSIRGKSYLDLIKVRDVAFGSRPNLNLVIRSDGRLGADQHFHPPRKFGRELSRAFRRSLGVASKSSQGKGEDEGSEGFHNGRHNTSIISRTGASPRSGPCRNRAPVQLKTDLPHGAGFQLCRYSAR